MNPVQPEAECCHTCGTAFRLPSSRTCRVTVEDNLSAATPVTLHLAFCERCADVAADVMLYLMRVVMREATADVMRRMRTAGLDTGTAPA